MNSEHISTKELRDYYGLEIIKNDDAKDKCEIRLFGSEITKNIHSITNSLRKLYEIESIIKSYGDRVVSYYIKNNRIWVSVLTIDGLSFDTDMRGCVKRYDARRRFINVVEQNGDKLLSTYYDSHTPVYIEHRCGHEPHLVAPNNYLNGQVKCPICSHERIVPYVNDCYTLRPDLIKYFKSKNDAVGIAVHDKKYKEYYCPICGQPKMTKLSNIASFGFSCNYCSDGIPYSEKVMGNVLTQLGVDYCFQERFDWSYYYDENGKRHRCIYDFVIKGDNIIIETDGGFHYNECKSIRPAFSLEDRKKIDGIKNRLAADNGYLIIRIDCNYDNTSSRFDYIKQNIIKALSPIYTLDIIDWRIVERSSEGSKIEQASALWESNNRITTSEIAEKLNTSTTSIIQYLKTGTRLGICSTYSKELSNKRQAKNKSSELYEYMKAVDSNGSLVGVFYDIDNFIYNYYQVYGVLMRKQSIRELANGRSDRKTHKGLCFHLISKDEYSHLLYDCRVNDLLDDPNRIIVMSSTHLYDDDLWR